MPAAEVDVTPSLVRSLLAEQHPDLAHLPLTALAHGWDNVMFRLGDDLTVRVPRREVAARLIDHEQQVLGYLAERLPLAVPAPVRSGSPSDLFPWPWSVAPWLPGSTVAETDLADPSEEAQRLGEFLAALHRPAPDDVPLNRYRGRFVADNLDVDVQRAATIADGEVLLDRFVELIHVEPWNRPPVWIHGDLHPANMLATDRGGGGEISAVIDWGDVCGGDPATDLSVGWSLFGSADRETFRTAAAAEGGEVDDATWQRAEAWAVHFAIVYRSHSADNPVMAAIADRLVARLLDDDDVSRRRR